MTDEVRFVYGRSKSAACLAGGLLFLAVAIDARYFGWIIGTEFAQSWMWWACLIAGMAVTVASTAALVRPPLLLAADATGLQFGSLKPWKRPIHVAWDDVREIDVGDVAFIEGDCRSPKTEQALQIECVETVNLNGCGDMHRFRIVPGKSQYGSSHIALIGQWHFDEHVCTVRDRLLTLAPHHRPTRAGGLD